MKHLTQNKTVIDWIEEKIALVSPDKVMWIDGSEEQLDALRAEACKTGEMIKLNEDLLPGCLLHRTKPNDVARVENRTFICAESADQAGPTNNWMDPAEAYKMLYDIAKDSYKGRTMYVIPYSMGPVGSIMASETTAAAAGAVGVVRRDPMAMLPFCGYNMADYWQHWIDIGAGLDEDKAPKIFNVNWFRKDDDGNFLWPGFGDNMRVLEWIIKRCEGMVDADETAIGFVPKAEDINLAGIEDEVSEAQLKEILSVDNSLWDDEAKGIEEFYSKFGDRLPKALSDELNTLKANLEK